MILFLYDINKAQDGYCKSFCVKSDIPSQKNLERFIHV